MDFRTQIELPVGLPPITHAGQILMMGSCFVQNVGNFLKDAKFQLDLNPFGILYNPSSLSAVLIEILKRKVYKKGDLFFHNDLWHSPMHHGLFFWTYLGKYIAEYQYSAVTSSSGYAKT